MFACDSSEGTFCGSTGHDLRNVPSNDTSQIPNYGKKLIEVLLNYMGNKSALTLSDVETVKTTAISPEVYTEYITFCTLLVN